MREWLIILACGAGYVLLGAVGLALACGLSWLIERVEKFFKRRPR